MYSYSTTSITTHPARHTAHRHTAHRQASIIWNPAHARCLLPYYTTTNIICIVWMVCSCTRVHTVHTVHTLQTIIHTHTCIHYSFIFIRAFAPRRHATTIQQEDIIDEECIRLPGSQGWLPELAPSVPTMQPAALEVELSHSAH